MSDKILFEWSGDDTVTFIKWLNKVNQTMKKSDRYFFLEGDIFGAVYEEEGIPYQYYSWEDRQEIEKMMLDSENLAYLIKEHLFNFEMKGKEFYAFFKDNKNFGISVVVYSDRIIFKALEELILIRLDTMQVLDVTSSYYRKNMHVVTGGALEPVLIDTLEVLKAFKEFPLYEMNINYGGTIYNMKILKEYLPSLSVKSIIYLRIANTVFDHIFRAEFEVTESVRTNNSIVRSTLHFVNYN